MTTKALNTQMVKNYLKKAEGFCNVLEKDNIIKAENGGLLAELKLEKEHVNQMGTLHDGLTAALIDTYSCASFLTHPMSEGDPGASIDLYVRYFKSAPIGDEIVIKAESERVGKIVAYLKCDIKNKATEDLVSKGTVTIFIMKGLRAKL